eukprot:TRINITY_DN4051_c0_g2_i2.p1 TRINITY_DN4051_c0_g2~~TRINITY_DN4051_c0_g2_i2.p1  ORF type:complete len:1271 (+),score=201.88 TRINITY_DN4051_c0_g2_i2:321-3815(+)
MQGYTVRPEAPLVVPAASQPSAGVAVTPTKPPPSLSAVTAGEIEVTSGAKIRQPFKRPRMASRGDAVGTHAMSSSCGGGTSPASSSSHASKVAAARAPSCSPSHDEVAACVGAATRGANESANLWELCASGQELPVEIMKAVRMEADCRADKQDVLNASAGIREALGAAETDFEDECERPHEDLWTQCLAEELASARVATRLHSHSSHDSLSQQHVQREDDAREFAVSGVHRAVSQPACGSNRADNSSGLADVRNDEHADFCAQNDRNDNQAHDCGDHQLSDVCKPDNPGTAPAASMVQGDPSQVNSQVHSFQPRMPPGDSSGFGAASLPNVCKLDNPGAAPAASMVQGDPSQVNSQVHSLQPRLPPGDSSGVGAASLPDALEVQRLSPVSSREHDFIGSIGAQAATGHLLYPTADGAAFDAEDAAASDDDMPLSTLVVKPRGYDTANSDDHGQGGDDYTEPHGIDTRPAMLPHGHSGKGASAKPRANSSPKKSCSVVKGEPLLNDLHFQAISNSFDSEPTLVGFASKETYVAHFARSVTGEVQSGLSEIAAAWYAANGKLMTASSGIALVARNIYLSRVLESSETMVDAVIGPRAFTVQGDVRACARGDLWVAILHNHPPLLFRAQWRGVNPRGRMRCAVANEAAASWLRSQAHSNWKATAVTVLVCGDFNHELTQLDILHSYITSDSACDPLAPILGFSTPVSLATSTASLVQAEGARIPEIAGLNQEQVAIARRVAEWATDGLREEGAVLVRGVFGSGKSRTLAASIVLLDRMLTAQKDPRRIMLLCQTNVAVDAVLDILLTRHGWDNFARLGSFKTVRPELLHRTVSLLATRQAAVAELTAALAQRPPEVREALQAAVDRGVLPPRAVAWRRRRLVAATVASLEAAEHFGADALRSSFVLVDEAAQLTEPALICSLRRVAARRVALIGDPRQLPPRCRLPSLRCSMLERLWSVGPAAARLQLATQYRCHPDIAALGSGLFYGGGLRSGIAAAERGSLLGADVPPLAVILSSGTESRVGRSYRHDAEAQLCGIWAERALRHGGLSSAQLGVVCLYRAQAEACAAAARDRGALGVECSTVDAFQGGERDVIVLSCGRSVPSKTLDDFAGCPRRLNVALSRARRHLILVGTEAFLASHPILQHVLALARRSGNVHSGNVVMAG